MTSAGGGNIDGDTYRYDLDAVRDSAGAKKAALLGVDYKPECPTSRGPGRSTVDSVRAARTLSSLA